MKVWTERPTEEANLLNPSFCCTVLASSMSGYCSVQDRGLAFPLTYMVLPLVLHKATRDSMPGSIRTTMAAWLQQNASARVQFFDHLISLKPHTAEAIQFGMIHDWIRLGAGGELETPLSEKNIKRAIGRLSGEARDCAGRAQFVGRWFAMAGTSNTIMALWGIRP